MIECCNNSLMVMKRRFFVTEENLCNKVDDYDNTSNDNFSGIKNDENDTSSPIIYDFEQSIRKERCEILMQCDLIKGLNVPKAICKLMAELEFGNIAECIICGEQEHYLIVVMVHGWQELIGKGPGQHWVHTNCQDEHEGQICWNVDRKNKKCKFCEVVVCSWCERMPTVWSPLKRQHIKHPQTCIKLYSEDEY